MHLSAYVLDIICSPHRHDSDLSTTNTTRPTTVIHSNHRRLPSRGSVLPQDCRYSSKPGQFHGRPYRQTKGYFRQEDTQGASDSRNGAIDIEKTARKTFFAYAIPSLWRRSKQYYTRSFSIREKAAAVTQRASTSTALNSTATRPQHHHQSTMHECLYCGTALQDPFRCCSRLLHVKPETTVMAMRRVSGERVIA